MTTISREERTELVHAKVTLDGERAVIGGLRNDYATVTSLETGKSFEWAWAAVARVVAKGGKFKS